MSNSSQTNGLEIAVIGMSLRFPGSRTVEQFWQNLRDGVESITFFSDGELEASGHSASLLRDPNYVKARGVLEEIDLFDASFFGFSPREAEIADPQQRLMLECAWEALESSGYYPANYKGRIGVYAGVSLSTYLFVELLSNAEVRKSTNALQLLLGNDKDHIATRTAYKLNLKGPSVTIQTSCSTSLVAVHLACQSLLSGECDIALAGGASIPVPHRDGYYYQEGGILSPDGHCRAFDARGKGTVGGSGVGLVALKRLADAIADGDCIRAVIKGSAINNDGAVKIGYTAPSETGQAEAIRAAQFMAEVEPETISYVEAHGTATTLGDPIEIKALTHAFRAGTDKKNYCAIGSVKSNFGHLDAAAGVAGLIKTTLALEHKEIPPSLHFETPNPKINFADSPFFVNKNLSPWKNGNGPRRAGVSSFGIGGTNAHVIVEEAPAFESSDKGRDWQLLVLSAKTETALETQTSRLVEYLKQNPQLNFADVAHTLQIGRGSFDHRRMFVCRDSEDAISALEQHRSVDAFQEAHNRPVIFMFPGQGTQYVNMAAELYRHEPVFREHVDTCCEQLKPILKLDLRHLLFPTPERADEAARELAQTCFTQPALFVVEYALAQTWMAWGVRPHAFIGHSIGEYVAACLSGVFTLEDALKLVAARGRMIQDLAGGAMLAVPMAERDVLPLLNEELSLAAVNSSSSCVISGTVEAIEELQQQLTESGKNSRRLHTSHAFHSASMDPIIESFTAQVKTVKLNAPQIPYLSNVTGNWITAQEATAPDYWAKHLRQTVRFADGLSKLLKDPNNVLLETGPGTTLTTFAKGHIDRTESLATIASLPHPRAGESDFEFVTKSLGQLWLAGVEIDWAAYHAGEQRRRIPLPTYPFERQRYWISGRPQTTSNVSGPDDWFYVPLWKEAAAPSAKAIDEDAVWLAFVDESRLSQQLVESLEKQGIKLICVKTGEQFAKHDDRSYVINPTSPNDYDALFQEFSITPPTKILHLWNVAQSDNAGVTSLLDIATAFQKQNAGCRISIDVVSNNTQLVTGDEQPDTLKAALLGACQAMSQEVPNLVCRSIDIDSAESIEQQLLNEITSDAIDLSVAFRDGVRWVRGTSPVHLKPQTNTRLRTGGTYLITCGPDRVGYEVATYLAREARARLVIVEDLGGTAALPPSNGNGNGKAKNETPWFSEIGKLGGEVFQIKVDLSDRGVVAEALKTASRRLGQFDGVIHTTNNSVAESLTDSVNSSISNATMLHELTNSPKRDFFLLFSANREKFSQAAFNAFAEAHFAAGDQRTVSINWDTEPLSREERLDSLERILSNRVSPHVVVSKRNLAAPRPVARVAPREETQVESPKRQTRPVSSARSKNYLAPRTANERIVARMWEEEIGVAQVGVNDNFFQLGGDSLLALQLVSKLRQHFNVELSHQAFLQAPTVAQVVALIGDNGKVDRKHSSAIVELQRGESTHPLILIPPSGGNLFLFQEFARRLSEQQNVLGLQPKGLNKDEEPFTDIKELASYYLEALREVQPAGPYLLAGSSFGGAVAFEMARQLEAQHQEVALLALFDTPAPSHTKVKVSDENEFLHSLTAELLPEALASFNELAPSDRLAFVVDQLKRAQKIPAGTDLELATRILRVWRADLIALMDYALETYNGRAIFFRARERDRGHPQHPEQPWIEMVSEGLEVQVASGGHLSMFTSPHVESLAARFQARLAEATRPI